MNAREIIEAESPRSAIHQELRIFIADTGRHYCAGAGYPYLPVFANDPEPLAKAFPGARIIEYAARPVRVVQSGT